MLLGLCVLSGPLLVGAAPTSHDGAAFKKRKGKKKSKAAAPAGITESVPPPVKKEIAEPDPGAGATPAVALPGVVDVRSLDDLRGVCDALTPPERKRFGDARVDGHAKAGREAGTASEIHAGIHRVALAAAFRFRLAASGVEGLAMSHGATAVGLDATPELRGMAGALRLKLSDRSALRFTVPPAVAKAIAAARAAGRIVLETVVLPDADTMIGVACFTYPRSDSFLVHGRLVEAVLRDGHSGPVLGRMRTPLYAAWLREMEARRSAVRHEPRVTAGRARVLEGIGDERALDLTVPAIGRALLPCYQRGLDRDPVLHGSLVIAVTVDRKGRVLAARSSIDMLHAPDVAACVFDVLTRATFPRSKTARVTISLPLHFER